MKLNYKDAFRHQKFLEKTITTLCEYLSIHTNVTNVTETHLKNKAINDVENEEVELSIDRPFSCKVEDIVFLIKLLICEKTKLTIAIEKAKEMSWIDWKENEAYLTIDSAIEFNKNIHSFSNVLEYLGNLKSKEVKKIGTGYTFNVNKEQVGYRYEIEVNSEINFDRDVINNLHKNQLNKADKISAMIERAMLREEVDYEPLYDLRDSIDEIIEKYITSKINKTEDE
jgi:uncharacterized protein YfcZ (UPF0381/DUF406 family)